MIGIIILIVFVLAIIGVAIYFWLRHKNQHVIGWDCSLEQGTCVRKINGAFATQQDCLKTCHSLKPVPWACNPITGQCVQKDDGPYATQQDCLEACHETRPKGWACDSTSGQCVQSDSGSYTTQQECLGSCHKTGSCSQQSDCKNTASPYCLNKTCMSPQQAANYLQSVGYGNNCAYLGAYQSIYSAATAAQQADICQSCSNWWTNSVYQHGSRSYCPILKACGKTVASC